MKKYLNGKYAKCILFLKYFIFAFIFKIYNKILTKYQYSAENGLDI